jgi:hypothetical protein
MKFSEEATIEFQGVGYTAGSGYVDDERCIGYPHFPKGEYQFARGELRSGQGKVLGTCKITSIWRTPRSYVSSTMCQIEAVVDGKTYTGRGAGHGMLFKGRRKK